MSGKAKKRYAYIGLLRSFAMIMVIFPHLIAYRFPTIGVNYIGYYILNPLHIIQCCGAMGVSIFFITSGYLSLGSIGAGNYFKRFYKSVIVLFIEVFVAIMFCWLFSAVAEKIFAIMGYTSTYAAFTAKDWIETALLYRAVMYLPTVEGVLWFLVPFFIFKVLLLLFDWIFHGNPKKCLIAIYILFITMFMLLKYINNLYLITERFFYITIILIGYVFALQQKGDINKVQLLFLQIVNIIIMLISYALTRVGVDDGYITSVIYSTILFYGIYKIKDNISYNAVIAYFDNISLSFYVLHSSIGWIIAQGLYYIVFKEQYVGITLLLATISDLIIITLYTYIIGNPLDRVLNFPICKK